MTLTRWSPLNDFFNMQKEMNRIFGNIIPQSSDDEEYASAVWSPRVDIMENPDEYVLSFDMPGIDKSDVKMNFSDNTLKISGERRTVDETKDQTSHRIERVFGRFYRSFSFPTMVNSDGIKASYKDGVLTVRVTKAEESKPKQIPIN